MIYVFKDDNSNFYIYHQTRKGYSFRRTDENFIIENEIKNWDNFQDGLSFCLKNYEFVGVILNEQMARHIFEKTLWDKIRKYKKHIRKRSENNR